MSRRSRRRGRSGTRWRVLLIVGLFVGVPLLLSQGAVFSTGAFSSMATDRASTVNVTSDDTSLLELEKEAAVAAGDTGRLVNVTNNFGRSMHVTVELREPSRDDADLVVGGTNHGDAVSFTLSDGSTETIDAAVDTQENLTDDSIRFDTEASDGVLWARAANRTVPIN